MEARFLLYGLLYPLWGKERGFDSKLRGQIVGTILPFPSTFFRACIMLIWTTLPSGDPEGCLQWFLVTPPLSMRLYYKALFVQPSPSGASLVYNRS